MIFDNATHYIRALASDSRLSIVPVQLAADAWGVSRAAIDAMLRDGRLEEIRVDKTRYVSAESLIKLLNEWDKQIAKLRKQIELYASKREVVFYAPLMETVGLRSTVPADRKLIGELLGEISEKTYADDKILLSAIVHRQSTGTTSPGPGFFGLANALGMNVEDESRFLAKQMDKVWSHYAA